MRPPSTQEANVPPDLRPPSRGTFASAYEANAPLTANGASSGAFACPTPAPAPRCGRSGSRWAAISPLVWPSAIRRNPRLPALRLGGQAQPWPTTPLSQQKFDPGLNVPAPPARTARSIAQLDLDLALVLAPHDVEGALAVD